MDTTVVVGETNIKGMLSSFDSNVSTFLSNDMQEPRIVIHPDEETGVPAGLLERRHGI